MPRLECGILRCIRPQISLLIRPDGYYQKHYSMYSENAIVICPLSYSISWAYNVKAKHFFHKLRMRATLRRHLTVMQYIAGCFCHLLQCGVQCLSWILMHLAQSVHTLHKTSKYLSGGFFQCLKRIFCQLLCHQFHLFT